jgi:glyoxylase-like metal-dependent hydrolase (beta-lactamase superfamily II)
MPDIVPGVHGVGSTFVNWYLVEEGGQLTAVDAGLPGFRGRLQADLASLGHLPGDVAAVILTHSDADHTGVAAALRDAGARVLIHEADADTLRRPRPKSGDASPSHLVAEMWRPRMWRAFGTMLLGGAARPTRIEGAETFAEGLLDVPGSPRVIPTPGHTPGHCAFHFERHRALFVGDELCTWNFLTGRRGPQLFPKVFNVSTSQCFESLAAIDVLEADVVLPGHGEPWRDGVAAMVEQARAGHERETLRTDRAPG